MKSLNCTLIIPHGQELSDFDKISVELELRILHVQFDLSELCFIKTQKCERKLNVISTNERK